MKRKRMGRRVTRAIAAVLVIAGASAVGVIAQPRPESTRDPKVALVGGLDVRKSELDDRFAATSREYLQRAGKAPTFEVSRILRRVALESLIRDRLLMLEAEKRGIVVSDAEALAEFRADPYFQDKGVFNQARLEAVKVNTPKAYQDAVRLIKRRLGGRKLNTQLMAELRPEDARVRADAERATKRAKVSFIGLRREDFSGEFPEPRETDILAYYRTHASQFRRPQSAILSVIEVQSPSNVAGDRLTRARADSAVSSLRRGGNLDAIAASYGIATSEVEIAADRLPSFWRGTSDDLRAVLELAPGTVLPRPVPSSRGWVALRVDTVLPERAQSLADAAVEIRRLLRDDLRAHHDDRELRAMYDARGAGYRVRAVKVRYAVLDTARMKLPEPTTDELDVFYRGHMADYTSYDAASASIRVRPLAEVRREIRDRWMRDRSSAAGRDWAARLTEVWRLGRRDRALEKLATLMRDVGPIPTGAPVDTGIAGKLLTGSLTGEPPISGGSLDVPGGYLVYHVYAIVDDYRPTFEQARAGLQAERAAHTQGEEEKGARALFDQDPARFTASEAMQFTRLEFAVRDPINVPLTRREVEEYFQSHIGQFSSPERTRVRHILVSPQRSDSAADAAARERANDLLRRVRSGEDFATLARENSDDPPTRVDGGDLGYITRGVMLEAFENAAFKLKPGEISELVKTNVGYHIIKCEGHEDLYVEPLEFMYSSVGTEAAREKGERLARSTADSLLHAVKTPEAAIAGAAKLGIKPKHYNHKVGTAEHYPEAMREAMATLEKMEPGVLYPRVEYFKGIGSVIMWVDRIVPVKVPSWGDGRDAALAAYRAERGRHAFEAKRAELDSMLASGWKLDSLATLQGGIHFEEVTAGKGLSGWKSADVVDSLLFGGRHAPVLDTGQASDWLDVPSGLFRIRLDDWVLPNTTQLAGRIESQRNATYQRNLLDYYDGLKRRFTVQILDPDLKGVALPAPRQPDGS